MIGRLLCWSGLHRWKPVVRGSLTRRESMAAYDFMLAYRWMSPAIGGIMAKHYIEALWRGFSQRGECCARCRIRRAR